MKWLWAGDFLSMLLAYRVCWFRGRFGGGKTALSVAAAAWLLSNGYAERLVANFPVCFASPVFVPLRDSVVILDESFLYLSSRQQVFDYAAYLRKLNIYLLLPSVFPIHYRLSFFSVIRVFNAQVVGLPLWIYRWDLNMGAFKERGYFALWGVNRLFGLFDTLYIPDSDGGIADAFSQTVPRYHQSFKKRVTYVDELDDALARLDEHPFSQKK